MQAAQVPPLSSQEKDCEKAARQGDPEYKAIGECLGAKLVGAHAAAPSAFDRESNGPNVFMRRVTGAKVFLYQPGLSAASVAVTWKTISCPDSS